MLIVLGFDSFDGARFRRFDTPTVDGMAETGVLKTPMGLAPSELNTKVLWASMFAGRHPKDLYPEFYAGKDDSDDEVFDTMKRGAWGNRLLDMNLTSRVEKEVVRRMPSTVNSVIKSKLAERGVEKESYVERRFRETETLVDAAESPRLISFPGINWDNSVGELKGMIEPYAEMVDGTKRHRIDVDAETFEREAMTSDVDRLVRTLYAIESGETDLLFTHFFSLDLVQHLWVTDDRKMRRWYDFYDHLLSSVLDAAAPEDTIVVVSDHGMQENGVHSTDAFYGATKPLWDTDEYQTEELAAVLESELRNNHSPGERRETSVEMGEETKEHLQDLGYF